MTHLAAWRVVPRVGALSALLVSATPAFGESARTHDGLYLRLGAGAHYMSDEAELDAGFEADGTLTGSGGALDLAVGGGVSPGVTLGGGFYFAQIGEPTAENMQARIAGTTVWEGDLEFDGLAFMLVAPFIDFYPRPSGGFHLNAAAGLAIMGIGDGNVDATSFEPLDEHGSTGFGVTLGAGYEWWVADSWSLGLLGKLSYASLSGEDDDDDVDWKHSVLMPALMLTATMN